jgi:hypothetical protein
MSSLEKVACGAFSDIGCVSVRQKARLLPTALRKLRFK